MNRMDSLIDYLDMEFYKKNELIGFLGVYVDDTLIMGNHEFYNTTVKQLL